jgi:cytoskeletal protein RodZ
MITYVQGSYKKYQQRLDEEKSEAELSKRKRIIDKNDEDAQKEKLKLNEERKRKIHQKEGEVKKTTSG